MSLGFMTENGIVMNAAPILLEEKDFGFLGLSRKNLRNEKVT
jgi:hypothetical protein